MAHPGESCRCDHFLEAILPPANAYQHSSEKLSHMIRWENRSFQRSLPSAPQDTHGWFDHCGSQPDLPGCEEQDSRSFFAGQGGILLLRTRGKQKIVHKRGNTRNKEGSYV
jgi:hypothetical protein